MCSKNSELRNFADNNTIKCFSETIKVWQKYLKEESVKVIRWFE